MDPRFVPLVQRVRAVLGGVTVADSARAVLALRHGHLPAYYLPAADVRTDLLEPGRAGPASRRGAVSRWSVRAGGRVAAHAAVRLDRPRPGWEPVGDHVLIRFSAMDAWFEEDDEVTVHPRDPFHRVDVLATSRHLEITADGVLLAVSDRPFLLLETGLPGRWYVPPADVRHAELVAHPAVTECPYKGVAGYRARRGDPDRPVAWTYRHPVPECPRIAGLMAFFGERVDTVVDGVAVARPHTVWS